MVMINLGSEDRLSGYVNYRFDDELPECDGVFCNTLHTQQRRSTTAIIKKIFKALKEPGKLILLVPDFVVMVDDYRNDRSDNDKNGYDDALELLRKRLYDNGCVTIFTPTSAINMLKLCGFTVKSMVRRAGNIEFVAVK